MKILPLKLLVFCIAGLTFSAGLTFANPFTDLLLGKQNILAAQLLLECNYQEALAVIEKEEQSDSTVYNKQRGLVLKGVAYQELGRYDELDAVCRQLVVMNGGRIKYSEDQARKVIGDMSDGLKQERKNKTGNEFCK